MVLHSSDWTNTGFSFVHQAVNLFRHRTDSTQDNHINMMDLLSKIKFMLKLMSLKCLQFYAQIVSKPVFASVTNPVVCCVNLNIWERWNWVKLLLVNVALFRYQSA